jgi:hypothetical protein
VTGSTPTPESAPGTAPAGGQFTALTAQPTSTEAVTTSAAAAAAAEGDTSGGELAVTGLNLSAPALGGAACFVILAGMLLSYGFARRRRKFTA